MAEDQENKMLIDKKQEEDIKIKINNLGNVFVHHENSKLPIIDQIYSQIGFGSLQYSSFFAFGFFLFAEGFYMSLIPSTMIVFKEFYDADDTTVCIVTSLLFVSFAIACIVASVLSSKFQRKSILLLTLILHIPFGIVISCTHSLDICILCLFMIGFGMGLAIPLLNNNLAEVLTINLRAFTMIFVWIFFVLAQLFYPLSMTFIMPNLEVQNLPTILKIGTTIVSMLLIAGFILFKDSPRSLLLIKDYDSAFKILEDSLGMQLSNKTKHALMDSSSSDVVGSLNTNLTQKNADASNLTDANIIDLPAANLVEENNQANVNNEAYDEDVHTKIIDNKSLLKQARKLFNPSYLKITIITGSLWFINANIFYGPSLILTLTIQKLAQMNEDPSFSPEASKEVENQEVFKELYFYTTAGLICLLLSAVLAEINIFGRKNTLIVSYSCATVVSILILIYPSSLKVLIVFLALFASIGFNVIGSFTSELYSTDVRDTALGMCFFFNRIGAVSSQFLFLKLFRIDMLLPYVILSILTFIASICSYLYPFDTLGRPLDMIK